MKIVKLQLTLREAFTAALQGAQFGCAARIF